MRWLMERRWRVVLVTCAVLLVLDAGRSVVARRVYAQPASGVWKPDPAVAIPMAWPPSANVPQGAPTGRRVFVERCAVCHGMDGRGNGPASVSLSPRPRDFSAGEFKYKSTAPGQPPTDADLERTIGQGLLASAMPGFGDLLSRDELAAVVAYVKSLSDAFQGPPPSPLEIPGPGDTTPSALADSVARGKELYVSKGCVSCHDADLRGGHRFPDENGQPTLARDLTAPWTFRGGASGRELWLRLTTGMAPGPMPSYADVLSPAERWDVANYVLASARIPPWRPNGTFYGPGSSDDPLVRGEYLVRFGVCGLCHTQIDPTGIYREEMFLAGGMRVTAGPHGVFVSRNLTSDEETGLGKWSVAEVARALRTGQTPTRALNPFAMLWPRFHAYSEDDANAIATYLQGRLAPVKHRIPPPVSYGAVETVIGKLLRPLPAAVPRALTYAEGDFALPEGAQVPGSGLRLLETAQWLVLAIGVFLWLWAGPRERRWPRSFGGVVRWIGVILLLVVLALVLRGLYRWPALRGLPPDPLVEGFTRGRIHPDLPGRSKEELAMVRRGEAIFQVTCAICHQDSGAGGLAISWRQFGTLYTRNISSDVETGVGGWSDAQLSRAIRSGISRNGRALHWQAMTWDQLSNLDEEDVRAVIAYLRVLPPVRNPVPLPVAPSGGDCATYTFYLEPGTGKVGCH